MPAGTENAAVLPGYTEFLQGGRAEQLEFSQPDGLFGGVGKDIAEFCAVRGLAEKFPADL